MGLRALLDRMRSYGDAPALIDAAESWSYCRLISETDRWSSIWRERLIAAGTVVALETDFQPESCAAFLGLLAAGGVAVPMPPALPDDQRRARLAAAGVEAGVRLTGDGEADFWSASLRKERHPLLDGLQRSGHPGIVLFTSGTAGQPKAVLHDAERLLKKFLLAGKAYRTLGFFSMDHIAGLDTWLYVMGSGGTFVCCADRSPDGVAAAVQRSRVEVLPTSPTFLTLLLLSGAEKRSDLSSLQVVTYGSEPMAPGTLERAKAALPRARFVQKYGMSEIGAARSKCREGDSLWIKISGEGMDVKVVDGVLWVKAETAMLGYLNAPQPFDDKGWLNTQDRVEADGEYLRFLGRITDLINVGGMKVYPSEVEAVLVQMPCVVGAVVKGEPHPLTGQIVTALVSLSEPEELEAFKQRMHAFCKGKLAPYQIPVKVAFAPQPAATERFKAERRRHA